MRKRIFKAMTLLAAAAAISGCSTAPQTDVSAEETIAQESGTKEETSAKEDAQQAPSNTEENVDENISPEEFDEEFLQEMDFPEDFVQERCGKTSFESYDEIVSLLEPTEAYAYVNVKGSDEPVLFIAESTFKDEVSGPEPQINTIEAYPYILNQDGKYISGGVIYSDSTATPLAVSDDGMIYCATHDSIEALCLGDNGTSAKGIMVMKYLYISYDENGNIEDGGGFVRDKNTVIDNDGTNLTGDEAIKAFDEAFDEYNKCTKIEFTEVE